MLESERGAAAGRLPFRWLPDYRPTRCSEHRIDRIDAVAVDRNAAGCLTLPDGLRKIAFGQPASVKALRLPVQMPPSKQGCLARGKAPLDPLKVFIISQLYAPGDLVWYNAKRSGGTSNKPFACRYLCKKLYLNLFCSFYRQSHKTSSARVRDKKEATLERVAVDRISVLCRILPGM